MREAAITAIFLLVASPAWGVEYFSGPTEVEDDQEWTNYLRLVDLDDDGDLDLVVPSCGGFFEPPVAAPFRIYDNDGGVFTEVTAARLGETPSLAVRVVAAGDVDGDGDVDLFAPNADGALDRLYINDGDGAFADEAATRLPAGKNASHSAGARFGDVDGDGDLDLLVAQGYDASDSPPAWLLLNDGAGHFTDATANLPQTFPGTDPDDVDFLDVDRDFDLDVLINAHAGSSALWENDGTGNFTDVSNQMPGPVSGPFHYGPSACDVDGDGDLDIIVDNTGGQFRREQLLINDGTGQFSDETAQLGANDDADDNGVMCVDVDDDGDFDLAIPSLASTERLLINDGGTFTRETGGFASIGDPTLWMDLGDVNGDGRIDAVTGQGESNVPSELRTRLFLGSASMPVDATPPNIITHQTTDEVDMSADFTLRFAVSDRAVTDSGPRVRAFAVTTNGVLDEMQEIEATFMGGDLYRVALPALEASLQGTVRLCATDAQGNQGCSDVMAYGGEGGSGAGGSSSGPGVGGGGGASSGTGAAGGAGNDGFDVKDDGCGCRVVGSQRGPSRAWAMLWLLGAALYLRRQRGD